MWYIVGAIMLISIMLPVFNIFMDTMNTSIQQSTDVEKAQDSTQTLTDGFRNSSDIVFATVFFALYIGAIILAYFIDTDPLFLIAGIIILILISWVGMYFADAFYDISTDDTTLGNEIQTNFPIMKFIMSYFLEINLVLLAIVGAITYGKLT